MKRYKLIAVLLVVALVAVLCAACTVTEQPQIAVKVNGKEVKANGTVYAVEFDNDVTKAVIEATATVGKIDGTGTFDLKEGNNEFVLTLKANNSETKYTVKVTRKASEKPADVTLAEVKVGETVLTAAAGKYATTVGYEVSSVTVAATATDSAATVDGTGEKTLVVGKNEVTLTVKSGEATQTYTVEITREAAVLTLAEVKVGETTLTADGNGVYTHTVANTVSVVTIAATATKSYATVEGAGEKTLALGANTFTLTVKADDNTTEQYTVKVTREAADLTLKEVKIGDEVLTAQDRTYTCNVANDVTEVTLSATANNGDATLQGAGTKQNLVVGENRFELVVSVGEEKATYTVFVNRAKSSVKTIASIMVDGTAATYNQENATYTATVGKYTATVVITLDSTVASYALDEEIGTLAEGNNEFVITVTAEDGTTATYTLVLNVVLPMFNVSYIGNIDGAVTNEGYTYKYGEKQAINITLAAAYTQSYKNLVVTCKVGDGEAKSVTLDDNYGFEVPAAEAIGNIVVEVGGIAINTYTVTYHRGSETTTETVEHGKDAQNATITPNTETKDVLDGYTYMHDEKWVTEDGGMIVATLTNITADMDAYYKDEVLVRSEVAYYAPMGGAVTYYTIKQMNSYVAGLENGDVVFKVLIKSVATDGSSEEEGKTSFVIYGTAVYNPANEMGVFVMASELNKWFTVKASAADKKVTVYRPDGTVATEKTFEAYAADTISLAIHADAAVAAVNPAMPELCTVTYLDENGAQLHVEKVIKGTAASYVYEKDAIDLDGGYKQVFTSKWLTEKNGTDIADLSNVQSNVTVYLGLNSYVYKHYEPTECPDYTRVLATNKYISSKAEVVRFRIRVLSSTNTKYPSVVVYPSTTWSEAVYAEAVSLYVGDIFGQWLTVEINQAKKTLTLYKPDGTVKETKTVTNFALSNITLWMNSHSFDIAVDVETVEFYDTDKTTLLYSGLVSTDGGFVYTSATDSEGYTKTVDTWLPIDGSANKMYAAKATYSKTTANPNLYNYVTLSDLNKYVVANENGVATFKVKFTFNEWTSFKLFETAQSTKETMQIGLDVSWSGKWFTFELDTTNKTLKMTRPDGTDQTYKITSTNVSGYAFMRVGEKEFSIEVVNL